MSALASPLPLIAACEKGAYMRHKIDRHREKRTAAIEAVNVDAMA